MKTARLDEKEVHKTPRGIAIWPHLIEANTKFNPGGIYDVRIKITDKLAEAKFLAGMLDYEAQAYRWNCQAQSKASLPKELPPWKQNGDGLWEFKFKMKASGVFEGRAWTNDPPKIFDTRGEAVETSQLKIGNGSEIRVFFQIRPYYVQKAGIALRLKAVQLLNLVTYDDATSLVVEPEDGDFVAPGPANPEKDALVDALEKSIAAVHEDIPF